MLPRTNAEQRMSHGGEICAKLSTTTTLLKAKENGQPDGKDSRETTFVYRPRSTLKFTTVRKVNHIKD